MARSLPPTHALLVNLHKSDAPNYSPDFIARLQQFPGVRVVAPHASSLDFIRGADLVFAIQGTIGLEAALLGKQVIMFGDSPVKVFPSVATFGRTIDLPALVRARLAESRPQREMIVDALAAYLAPFYPASHNDWHLAPTDTQIEGYARFFRLLSAHVSARVVAPRGARA
jgi:capsule polysaccharide export protein KpsC/LpsZ